MRLYLRLSLFALLVTVWAGCTQTTGWPGDPGPSNSVAWNTPTVGTIYVYQIINVLPTTNDTGWDTVTVIANGLTRLGKTGVFETAGRSETTLYHPEANGDIFTADLLSSDPHWSLFPTGSGVPISDVPVDSMRLDGTHVRVTSSRSFAGQEPMTIVSRGYTSLHAIELDSTSAIRTSDSSFSVVVYTNDFWFIPEIGSYGKQRISNSNRSTHNSTAYTTTVMLIGYFPK